MSVSVPAPVDVIRAPAEMRARAETLRASGRRICLVPTMGYLHDGHMALLRAGRERADVLILSIFVNPTQFGENEDLAVYPRDEAGDLRKASGAGVDIAFCPDAKAMYPAGFQSYVTVNGLDQPLCGASRPGHFRGVATVVSKLFHLCAPHLAIFGQKDFQQLAIIRRMVRDLDFAVAIEGVAIVREADGLAMSSRNAYLSSEERGQAVCLWSALQGARRAFIDGERHASVLIEAAQARIDAAPLARIDYLEIRDADSLESVDTIARPAVLAMAVFLGKTRLIDNTVLDPDNP